METYNSILRFIDINLIYSLFPMVLWLILIKKIFKERFETEKALIAIIWIVIIYTILSFLNYAIGFVICPNEYAFINRATGHYAWAYWLMLFGSTILPFSLFYKKMAAKPLYLLLVLFLMKIGFYFERFVILVTSLDRDYIPSSGIGNYLFLTIFMFFLQGFILALILLGVFEILKKLRTHNP
jgi:hypothetical protein